MWFFFIYWVLITADANGNLSHEAKVRSFTERDNAINFYEFAKVKEHNDTTRIKRCKNLKDSLKVYPMVKDIKIDSVFMLDAENLPQPMLNADR